MFHLSTPTLTKRPGNARSEECLRGLLDLEPDSRWTVTDALQSPLFQNLRCAQDECDRLSSIDIAEFGPPSVELVDGKVILQCLHYLHAEVKEPTSLANSIRESKI